VQVIFVGVYGGSKGAAFERNELAKLGKMFEARQAITDINDLFLRSLACCISCGKCNKLHSLLFHHKMIIIMVFCLNSDAKVMCFCGFAVF